MIGYQLSQMGAGIFATWMLFIAIKIRRKGSRQAGFFLLAWSVFLAGVVIYVLKDMGFLPYTSLTIYMMPIGSAIEGVLLSFGLADRINVLRMEKEQSQAQALAASQENERIIREQNAMLESKVNERTSALQESNEHLKRTQVQLVNAEKMASLGQLTAGIAHEINNPINFITSNIQPLRRNLKDILEVMKAYQGMTPEDAAWKLKELKELEERIDLATSLEEMDDIIESIAEGSSRTAEIVRGLRNFSRLDEDDIKEVDLNDGIRSTLTVMGPQYRDRVDFELQLDDLPKVECFPGKVNQVFMNILTNAAQATLASPGDKPRRVTISSRLLDDAIEVRIADNGVGMTEEVKARIFDPFFTTKEVGEGTGLGLAIVYGIIEDHQGAISLESTSGVGTEFRIVLPLCQSRSNQRRA
jgi:two-component system NtrC family sensor kinase